MLAVRVIDKSGPGKIHKVILVLNEKCQYLYLRFPTRINAAALFPYILKFSYILLFKNSQIANYFVVLIARHKILIRDLSEISRGEGGGNRGRVTTFWDCRKGRGHKKWAVKRGRVMQISVRDHIEVHPQKKKEILNIL